MAGDAKRQVWLTSALTESDVPQALTLCFSLKQVMTCKHIGVITSKKLPFELIETLHQGFDYLFYLEERRNTAKLRKQDFVKLFPLTLKPFEMCVFLSPTLLVIKNCDQIFDEFHKLRISGSLLMGTTGLDVIGIRPSWKVYENLMECLVEITELDMENYIRTWAENNKETFKRLPNTYNYLLTSQNLPQTGENEVMIVNTRDARLDMNTEELGLFTKLLLKHWNTIYLENVQPLLTSIAKRPLSTPNNRISQSVFSKEPIAIVGMSFVFVLPVAGVLLLMRVVVDTSVQWYYKDRIKLLHPVDALNSVEVEGPPWKFTFCCLVATENALPILNKLKRKVGAHVDSNGPYKKLRYRLSSRLGYPCWEDTAADGMFKIENHVKLFPGVEEESKIFSEKEIMSMFRETVTTKRNLDAQLPDWGIFLVPKVRFRCNNPSSQNPVYAAIFIQINHGYMDGTSGADFVKTCVFDEDEQVTTTLGVMRELRQSTASWQQRLARFTRALFYGLFKMTQLVFKNEQSIFHVTSPGSEMTFVGCCKSTIQRTAMNRVTKRLNCESRSIITYAFLKTMMEIAKRKGLSTPEVINLGYTHAFPPDLNSESHNRFSMLIRNLPTRGSEQLAEIDKLIQMNEESECVVDCVFMSFYLMGLLPSSIFCYLRNKLTLFKCAISFIPAPEGVYRIDRNCIDHFFVCPPALASTYYACTSIDYGGKFDLTFHIRKTPLVENQSELQDFIAEFEECFSVLVREAEVCERHNHSHIEG
ncbi:unnamed protein product [Orchesella dallaii]|uniref:O-acyltransferase WSD1 C-terminal domain-containing protein n=1 Tax=Orchesella dallaii TaxID=48710 RepID=A0ABP1Q2Y8_9HEXA